MQRSHNPLMRQVLSLAQSFLPPPLQPVKTAVRFCRISRTTVLRSRPSAWEMAERGLLLESM